MIKEKKFYIHVQVFSEDLLLCSTSVTRLFCQNPEEQLADVFSVLLNFSSYVCLSSGGTKWPPIKMTSKHHQKFPTNHKPFRISTNSHFDEFSHFPTCFIEFLDKKQVLVAVLAPKLDFDPSSTDQVKKQYKALKLTCSQSANFKAFDGLKHNRETRSG